MSVMNKNLLQIISTHAYEEIVSKVKEFVGEEASKYILPGVIKALEESDRVIREDILIEWLDVESMRVCTHCGAIMEEGWYMECGGYACSDECAAQMVDLTMEEFAKWRIYKADIVEYLRETNDARDIGELSAEECDKIIEHIALQCDSCWTEWY